MDDSQGMSSAEIALERLKSMQLRDRITAETGVPGLGIGGDKVLYDPKDRKSPTIIKGAPEIVRALDIQEGGSHYKDMAIQPVEYITANKIEFMEGNVIKYVSRHANKNGAQDIKKAIHFLNLILDLRYPESK